MLQTALQLRIDPRFAKTFRPSPQAVLDAQTLDFLETFPGASLVKRNSEELCINLLLPPTGMNKSGYKVEYWCDWAQKQGIQCEYLDIKQILQTPFYPQILPSVSSDEEEALNALIQQLFKQCGQETTAVSYNHLPDFYQEAWGLGQDEISQSSFWRFTLLFSSQKLVWYRQEAGGKPLTLPTIESAFFSLVRQCMVLAEYPEWIGYDSVIGNGSAEDAYKHARIYPVWQKEFGSLYRLVGQTTFDRLLRANFDDEVFPAISHEEE